MPRFRRFRFVLVQMFRRYFENNISASSAELAYFLLFSFFPLIMLLNSILAHIDISAQALGQFMALVPRSMQDMIETYLNYLSTEHTISPMILGGILTLFFLSRAMNSLLRTANRIYGVKRSANSLIRLAMALILTLGFVSTILGSFFLVVVGRTLVRLVEHYIPLYVPEVLRTLTHQGGYFIMIVVIFLFLLLFNRVAPNVRSLRWRNAVPGTCFSLIVWLLLSVCFSFYVDNMARYSVLYGSLGAIIVLMLWLYLSAMAIILGVQLNHILWKVQHVHAAWNTFEKEGK